jgi:hypothetical protein
MSDPNSPTLPAESAPTGPLETPLKTRLNASEAATMAEWTKQDLAKGKISAEQAEKIFSERNAPQTAGVTKRNCWTNSSPRRNRKTTAFSITPLDKRCR